MSISKWSGWICLLCFLAGWGRGIDGYAQRVPISDKDQYRAGVPPVPSAEAIGKDSVMRQVGELLEQLEHEGNGVREGAEGGEGGEDGAEERALAYEYFEQLLGHPLAINRASDRELEQLYFLSDFQIASLLTYREEHGVILSGTELALLNGFNEQIVKVLRYFVTFEADAGGMKPSGSFRKDCRSELWMKSGVNPERGGKPAEGVRKGAISPVYTYFRYQCDYLDRIRVGFTLENDAGERFLGPWRIPLSDFFSFHAHLKSLRIGKIRAEVVVGDFAARFGQGLVLWKSFQLNGALSPDGLYKRGVSVMPYASSDESRFLRGGAVSLSRDFESGRFAGLRGWEVTGFVSYRGVDARVEGEKYTSIQSSGLHRPGSGEQNRHALHESMGGARAAFTFSRWKLGMSWVTYGYDKSNGRRVAEYNRDQLYDGVWGNVAFDVYAVAGPFRIFGELAADYGGGVAGLLGVLFRAGAVELGVLGRSYARGYIAPHAGAYSTLSGCSNQRGITVNGRWNSGRAWAVSGNLEFSRYPAPRYLVPSPSWVVGGVLKGEYRQGRWDGYLRFSERFSTDRRFHKLGIKGAVGYPLRESVRLGLKGEWVAVGKEVAAADAGPVRRRSFSGMCSVELSYVHPNGKVSLRGGWCWFSAQQWDGRLYGYEAGLPGSYGSVLLYGRGHRGYVTAKVRLFSGCDVYGRGSLSGTKKGGGEDELPAPRFRLQLGLKIKF